MKLQHAKSADDRLGTAAAARIIGVHPQTLRDYERAGHITSERTPGGHRRYRRADVEALANGGRPALADEPATPKAVSA